MLGSLFYPKGTEKNPIPFESLYIPYIYKEIYLDGVYIDVFNNRKDMIILDIGANIGVVTQYMRNYAKHVYAIEPSPEHFEALQKNKLYNDWDNVSVHNVAIAEKNGTMEFSQNKGNRTMNTLVIGEEIKPGEYALKGGQFKMNTDAPYMEKIKVKTQTLEDFFKQNKIKEVDFCKLDIEGYEDILMRSESFQSVARKMKMIEVEFHFPNWQELVNIMIQMGFEARRYECSAIVVLFIRK